MGEKIDEDDNANYDGEEAEDENNDDFKDDFKDDDDEDDRDPASVIPDQNAFYILILMLKMFLIMTRMKKMETMIRLQLGR